MIPDILSAFVTPRSMVVRLGSLTRKRIEHEFRKVRGDLIARTLHVDVRRHDPVTEVSWSLSAFVDRYRNVGAVPEIVCRP